LNKTSIIGAIVLMAVAAIVVFYVYEPTTYHPYDVNQDGIISSADAEEVFAHRTGEAPYEEKYDLNGDGVIDIYDCMLISNHEDFVE
jgi:hypothetical protein